MSWIKKNIKGLLLCLVIATVSWELGTLFPVIGGSVIAIVAGMLITLGIRDKTPYDSGIKFASGKILKLSVVLLGFGMNLNVIVTTGLQSLPIIICTITISLVITAILQKWMRIPSKTAVLVGVGSSICGGSAIAATAPVIDADDDEVAQAISVIFFFNVLAALLFPILGQVLGFSTTSGDAFGTFAGTAVNDTSSVTAAASTWDSMWGLGSATLDRAVTVKLTRTLAIIPITLALAFIRMRRERKSEQAGTGTKIALRQVFPMFVLYFILASIVATVAISSGVSASVFAPLKELSKFLIVVAMAAVGLNSNMIKLIKSGGKPIALGLACWIGITVVSIAMQYALGII